MLWLFAYDDVHIMIVHLHCLFSWIFFFRNGVHFRELIQRKTYETTLPMWHT